MKCIKSTKKEEPIRRVSDNQAEKAVQTGMWAYCGKQEWKQSTRGAKTNAAETPE
jgi:hypothetical protein